MNGSKNKLNSKIIGFLIWSQTHTKYIRHIELDRYEIYYSINDCQINNKFHDFYLHKLSILIE